jgi:hypothetical protein
MKRFIALYKFLWRFLLGAVCVLLALAGMEVWFSSKTPAFEDVPDYDYLPEMRQLLEGGQFGDLLALGRFVEEHRDLPNAEEIIRIKTEVELDQARWVNRVRRFSEGFLLGEISSMESAAGTVLSDFLVIGDVRDLVRQGYHYARAEETDRLIVVLSSAGVAASAAAWIPEPGTTAAGAAAQPAISMAKGLAKGKALSGPMTRELLEISEQAARRRDFSRLGPVLTDMSAMTKNAPAGTLVTCMKRVDSTADLKRAARWVEAAPHETAVWLRMNPGGMDWLHQTAVSKTALGSVLRKGPRILAKTAVPIRAGKFFYRGRLGELKPVLQNYFLQRPETRRWIIWGCAGLMLMALGFFWSSGAFARRLIFWVPPGDHSRQPHSAK